MATLQSCAHSKLTQEQVQVVKHLYNEDLQLNKFVNDPNDLFLKLQTISSSPKASALLDLLSQKQAPAYRYLVYYLLELFQEDLKTAPEFPQTVQEQAAWMFQEIAQLEAVSSYQNRYENSALLRILTDLIFQEALDCGFAANQRRTRIHASLHDPNATWTKGTLCRDLFFSKNSQWNCETFFTLSLILSFDGSFIEDYLTRVFGRSTLNTWDIHEALIYALSSQNSPLQQRYPLYMELLKSYESMDPAALPENRDAQTDEILNTANLLNEALDTLHTQDNIVSIVEDARVQQALALHKGFVQDHARSMKIFQNKFSPSDDTMVEYLVSKYQAQIPNHQSITSLKENLFDEIHRAAGQYDKNTCPWQTRFTDFVFEDMKNHGFSASSYSTKHGVQHEYVHASLWNAKQTWSKNTLCRALFAANQMQMKNFFTLAFAIPMDMHFAFEYFVNTFAQINSQKALQELKEKYPNHWQLIFCATNMQELLVYLLCSEKIQVPSNTTRYDFYHHILQRIDSDQASQGFIDTLKETARPDANTIWSTIDKTAAANTGELDSILTLLSAINKLNEQEKEHRKAKKKKQTVSHPSATKWKWPPKNKVLIERKTVQTQKQAKEICPFLHTAERKFIQENDDLNDRLSTLHLPDSIADSSSSDDDIPIPENCHAYFRLLNKISDSDHSPNKALIELMKGNYPSDSKLSNIKNGKTTVTRKEFLTVIFLNEVFKYDEPPKQNTVLLQISSIINELNQKLRCAGFDIIYLMNPYDCFLLYVSLFPNPFEAYFDLWSICYKAALSD